MFVKPALRPGVAALAEWLRSHEYSAFARERILNHVAATGCLASATYLDREDEEAATEAFVAALPEVADGAAWDREDVFLDAEMLADGSHPLGPFGTEPDEATLISHEAPDGRHVARKMIGNGALPPPIAGGAPTPTDSDRRDFESWLSQVDADYPPADQDEPGRRSWEARTAAWNDARDRGESWAVDAE
jgi:hypothetical protein